MQPLAPSTLKFRALNALSGVNRSLAPAFLFLCHRPLPP